MDKKNSNLTFSIIFISLLCLCGLGINSFYTQTSEGYEIYEEVPFQKGTGFAKWGEVYFNSTNCVDQILEMKETGIEWVGVHYWWTQDTINSKKIYPQAAPDVPDLFELFDFIHAQDMKILFKPMISVQDGNWRSFINVSPEWLDEYARIILDAAEMAKNGSVEILSIGCEMGSWQVHTKEARNLIADVRTIYSGLLTYSANHDSFWQIEFWDDLDFIGIDAYYAFTTVYDPTYDEMSEVWDGFYDRLNKFHRYWDKPIAFMEIGRSGRDGNNIGHFFEDSDEQDILESQLFYETFFDSKIWSASWFKGVYWWMWDTLDYDPREDLSMAPDHPVIKFTIEENFFAERTIVTPNYTTHLILLMLLAIMLLLAVTLLYYKMFKSTNKDAGNLYRKESVNYDAEVPKLFRLSRQYVILSGLSLGSSLFWLFTYFNELVYTSFINWTMFLSTRSSIMNTIYVFLLVSTSVLSIIIARKLFQKILQRHIGKMKLIVLLLNLGSGVMIFVLETFYVNYTTHNMSWVFIFLTSQIMIFQIFSAVLFIRFSRDVNPALKNTTMESSVRMDRIKNTILYILIVSFGFFMILSLLLVVHSRLPSLIIGIINGVIGCIIYYKFDFQASSNPYITKRSMKNGYPLYALGYYYGILPFYDRHALFTFNLPLLASFFIPISISVLLGIFLIKGFESISDSFPLQVKEFGRKNRDSIVKIFGILLILFSWIFPVISSEIALVLGGIPLVYIFINWLRNTVAANVNSDNNFMIDDRIPRKCLIICPRKLYYLLLIGFTLNAGMIGIIAVYPYLGIDVDDIVQITHDIQLVLSIFLCLISIFLQIRFTKKNIDVVFDP